MLILASRSKARQAMLQAAGIPFEARPARIDEASVKDALRQEGHPPRAVADALAELKALRIRAPDLVLGCDQVLDHDGAILSRPDTPEAAIERLTELAGGQHRLHSAAVLVEDGQPVWRHVATVAMTMRPLSPGYIDAYVTRNWETIRHTPGAYLVEAEGARLFQRIDGDHFAVLGLPLLPLIDFLVARGEVAA